MYPNRPGARAVCLIERSFAFHTAAKSISDLEYFTDRLVTTEQEKETRLCSYAGCMRFQLLQCACYVLLVI